MSPRKFLFGGVHPDPAIHPSHWLPRLLHVPALTIWRHILVRRSGITVETLRHELMHVEQFGRWGVVGFFARYWYWQIARGYDRNPIEIEARGRLVP